MTMDFDTQTTLQIRALTPDQQRDLLACQLLRAIQEAKQTGKPCPVSVLQACPGGLGAPRYHNQAVLPALHIQLCRELAQLTQEIQAGQLLPQTIQDTLLHCHYLTTYAALYQAPDTLRACLDVVAILRRTGADDRSLLPDIQACRDATP